MNVTRRQWLLVLAIAGVMWVGIGAIAYGVLHLTGAVR